MNIHKNARTTPKSRASIVELHQKGVCATAIAKRMGVSRQTVSKWVRRHSAEGVAGLIDRSSRPHTCPAKLSHAKELAILALRKQMRLTAREISKALHIARSTVSYVLNYYGLGRLENMNIKEPVIRYEREKPGDLVHIDIKKLGKINEIGHRIHGDRKRGKGKGWEYLHIAIDDHSRLAYAEILPNEKARTSAAFLLRALRFFKNHGITVLRVMTDNGVGYVSKLYKKVMELINVKHKRTRPYTPKTNGKAERFIQTCLRQWAYAKPYHSSQQRTQNLATFLDFYNHFREHAGINYQTPISRI